MKKKKTLMENIRQAVWAHDRNTLDKWVDVALGANVSSGEVRLSLIEGLENIRQRLMSNDISIPEFLLSSDMVTERLHKLSSSTGEDRASQENIPLVSNEN